MFKVKDPPAERRYDVKIDDRMLTPATLARLKRLIIEGRLKKYHRVRVTGTSEWKKAGDIPELKPFFLRRATIKMKLYRIYQLDIPTALRPSSGCSSLRRFRVGKLITHRLDFFLFA